MAQKIIVKNKRTRELLELTLPEFKEKFKAELKTALDNFEKQESRKNFLPPYVRPNNNFESDFYFSLRWNFNNLQNSNWYIERIL